MTTSQIKHFLLVYNIPAGKADVHPFGHDYAAALAAYSTAEEQYRDNSDVEVVLLGSDSVETLERTHSSYFDLAHKHINDLVARELAGFAYR